MAQFDTHAPKEDYVSPYLLLPLRSLDQACEDRWNKPGMSEARALVRRAMFIVVR